jgi:hypothetical protein
MEKRAGVEGLACWLAICHYGHTFSFFLPEKVKKSLELIRK